jgi:hypothetical protein
MLLLAAAPKGAARLLFALICAEAATPNPRFWQYLRCLGRKIIV